jgi:phosphatidylserine/phosphatidylglycerophosphate/cardiolipin synthase-like enzyme
MKIKTIIKIFIILFLAYNIFIHYQDIKEIFQTNKGDSITGGATGTTTQQEKIPIVEQNGDLQVYFCPREDCQGHAIKYMQDAKNSIHCALFDLDLAEMITFFDEQSTKIEVQITVDDTNYETVKEKQYIRKDNDNQLMHNKFCVIDGKKIWTGSFNPTTNDNSKNNNNLILADSTTLATNYETEFQEIWNGQFGKGARNENSFIQINETLIENYFCPEDWCANKAIFALDEAKKSIQFMTFSFTHDGIGNKTREKALSGLDVKGVFEKSQNNDYTEYEKMLAQEMEVTWDGNTRNMHHKVFIIDNETVITGSFNPSANGDQRNDENVLIIHDKKIAERFLEEFEYVWEQAKAAN